VGAAIVANCRRCHRPFGDKVQRSRNSANLCGPCDTLTRRERARVWHQKQRQLRGTGKKEAVQLVPVGTWCLCLPSRTCVRREPQCFDFSYLEGLISRVDDPESCCLLSAKDSEQIRLALGYIREREEDLQEAQRVIEQVHHD